MKHLESYNQMIKETEILKQRLEILLQYEKQIEREQTSILNIIEKNEIYINKIKQNLKEVENIENNLFYEIVINGLNVSKSIEKVAEKYDKDVSTLWKNYYPKVKQIIQEIVNN